MNIQGAKCVVTGASSGIGLEVSRHLLNLGAQVVGAARHFPDETKLDHPSYHERVCDVSHHENVDQLFE